MAGKNFPVIIAVMCVLCALVLLGDGITGFVVVDQTTRPLCETSLDCEAPEVCCPFADTASGVCHDVAMCGQVDKVTRKEFTAALQEPTQVKTNSMVEIAIGACVLLLILYLYSIKKIFLSMPDADE